MSYKLTHIYEDHLKGIRSLQTHVHDRDALWSFLNKDARYLLIVVIEDIR